MVVKIFPSELGALCGEDPFHSTEETISNIKKRLRQKQILTEDQRKGLESEQKLIKQGLFQPYEHVLEKRIRLTNGNVVVLRGRLDGIDKNENPVEVKHRTTQIWNELFERENIQIYAYMYLCDKKIATFMETNDVNEDIYIRTIDWEETVWQRILLKVNLALKSIFE